MSGLAGHNHSRSAPATEAGSDVLNLPNVITMGRLFAVPVAVWLTVRHHLAAGFAVFALAGVSDAVDGWLARRRGGSALGAMLDPLADKALLMSMFVTLALIGILPVWLAALAIGRDVLILIGLGVLWLRRVRVQFKPLLVSKLNTALQLLLVAAALFLSGFGLHVPVLLDGLVWVVAASTALSSLAYVREALR